MSTFATISNGSQVTAPAARAVIDFAASIDFGGGEYEIGYSQQSGYYYAYSDVEPLQVGVADFAFNRGEGVEFIFSCPETGVEFFGYSIREVQDEYDEHCIEMEIPEDEIINLFER